MHFNADAPVYVLDAKGMQINEVPALADYFNAFFASCYCNTTLPSNLPSSGSLLSPPSTTLNNLEFSVQEASQTLNKLRESCHPRPDNLPPTLLKKGGHELQLIITNLFNLSLKNGCFPTQWKKSVVIPHCKGGSRYDVNSYRGIHHTPHISRVFERLAKNTLLLICCQLIGSIKSSLHSYLGVQSRAARLNF